MKKKLLLFVLLFAGLMSVKAQEPQERKADGALDIENIINVVPGYSVNGQFDVVLTNLNTADNTAFQFDIVLPAGFSYKGYEAGELLNGHNVTDGKVDNNDNYRRFTAANTSGNTPFKARQGVLLTIKFSVAAETELGDKTINVKNAILTRDGDSWTVADFDKNIAVNRTITLDENETSAPVAIANVNVTVKRPLKGGDMWNTLVLPFDMSADQIAETFGSGTQVAAYNGDDAELDGTNIIGVKMKFESVSSMTAHTPYIIKVPSAMDEFTVSGVSITAAGSAPKTAKGQIINMPPYIINQYMPSDMIGTYATNTTIPAGKLYLIDNKFKFSKGNTKLKAFRAYFDVNNTTTLYTAASAAPAITLDVDGISTGISSATLDDKAGMPNEKYYTVQGLQVAQPTKGLYIVNGRKVIIK